jgi:hypothetical protein
MAMAGKVLFPAVLLAGMLCGCAVYKWTSTTGVFESSKFDYSMKTPTGWNQLAFPDGVIFTRHGTGLERVSLQFYSWGDTLSTKKKSFAKKLLLHELSWTFLTNLESCGAAYCLKVRNNEVFLLDSVVSTKTVFSFLDNGGLPMRATIVCAPMPKHVLVALYVAADRVYYDKSLPVFESMMSSVLFSPGVRTARVPALHEIESRTHTK